MSYKPSDLSQLTNTRRQSKELERRLRDDKVKRQLGLLNEEDFEEQKQQKYLYSINNRMSSEYSKRKPSNASEEDSEEADEEQHTRKLSKEWGGDDQNTRDDDFDSEEDEDDNMSCLSEISNETAYFESKVVHQRKALFRKNVTLQWRMKCTNMFQLFTPIFGIIIIKIFQEIGLLNVVQYGDIQVFVPVPLLSGFSLRGMSQVTEFITVDECDQWYMYEFDKDVKDVDKEFFGYNNGEPFFKPNSSGLLSSKGNIQTYPCNDKNKTVPYFKEFTPKQKPYEGEECMNDYLATSIKALNDGPMVFHDKNQKLLLTDDLPDGAFRIKEANNKKLNFNLQINDLRYWQYHRNNGISKIGVLDTTMNVTRYLLRQIESSILTASLLSNAYIHELFNDTHVVTGVNFYPFKPDFQQQFDRAINALCILVFPICLCMALPVFIYQIVLEKETRLTETMKINGMRMYNYWIVNFQFNMAFYMVTIGAFYVCGAKVYKMSLFTDTSLFLQFLIYFGWGLAQNAMALLFSVFVNRAQTATIVGYAVSVWLAVIAVCFNFTLYSPPNQMDWFLYPIPTFLFARLIFGVAYKCGYEVCIHSVGDLEAEYTRCLIFLYVTSFLYTVLALYLYQVVPQTYGVPKKWNYLCKRAARKKTVHRDTDEIGDIESDRESLQVPVFDYDMSLEDADSKAERNMVYNLDKADYYKYPLVVKDLRKVYPGYGGRPPKPATKSFCLRIKKGEMFGLLGPNGAGKTTLISMLTGLYKPNSGNAWVAGYDIKDQLEIVQLQIGVCPQFDVLWNDLTVEEHLLFYARLKGIAPEREYEQVNKAMEEVLLTRFRDFYVKSLSGGMKRRLSVAISLVSDPKIIFLDEPSTGLDPENRRQLWDILSACKGKRALVLTTHSMEEADVLCNRIGIVNDGILRCVGPQVRLKSIYGGGYHLFVNCQKGKVLQLLKKQQRRKKRQLQKEKENKSEFISHPMYRSNEEPVLAEEDEHSEEVIDASEITKRVSDFIRQQLPKAMLIREFNGNFVYQIPIDGFNAERLFLEMEKNRQRLRITDWGISQCSLEDVFTRIVEATQ